VNVGTSSGLKAFSKKVDFDEESVFFVPKVCMGTSSGQKNAFFAKYKKK